MTKQKRKISQKFKNGLAVAAVLFFAAVMILPALRNGKAERTQPDQNNTYFAAGAKNDFYLYLEQGETIFAEFSNTTQLDSKLDLTLFGPNNYQQKISIAPKAPTGTKVAFANVPVETSANGHIWKISSTATDDPSPLQPPPNLLL